MKQEKEYIYIGQYSLETGFCKIGLTDNIDKRFQHYNAHKTGKSKTNRFSYLFVCEVKNMRQVENDIKEKFRHLREENNAEVYFYNSALFSGYVEFIKVHPLYVKDIVEKFEEKKTIVKIVKKTKPSLKERGMTIRGVLQKAQRVDNDEFYTRYEDIKREIEMYPLSIWKNKVVFCNCDDAVGNDEKNTSAFALYFLQHFNELGLKKLICTHYGGVVDLFNQGAKGYIFTKDGFSEITDYEKLKKYPKGYTGSFDDPISLDILKEEADIVCTNPPFSRAIDYWKLIINSGKKFLIISNIANILTHAYLPYFYANKVWAGYNRVDWYLSPKRELVDAPGHWYTNITIENRPKYKNLKIVPLKDIPDRYKKYDDSKVLLVDNCYIPNDYKAAFAVSARPILNGLLEKGYKIIRDKRYIPYINGKEKFARVLVQKL
jgi:hypothetical protein